MLISDFSSLRIIGLLLGTSGLLTTFLLCRGPRWKRTNFMLFSFGNLSLMTISIEPNIVNFVRDAFALQEHQHGRLIALLIISNIFLFFYSFYKSAKLEKYRLQFDQLIRSLGVEGFDNHPDFYGRIKPIMVLIPAYNEAENLGHLLPRMPSRIDGLDVGVLIVDDGSDDGTVQKAREMGALGVSNFVNRGGGAALRLGYDILKKAKTKICITMDADGQHRPEEVGKLVVPILNDELDFVIGSRVLGNREKDKVFRLMGVHVFGRAISLLLGNKITDPASGFRAFRMEKIGHIDLYEDQYHTSELIIETSKKGLRIGEVPITILKRKFGQSKKGSNWIYAFSFAKTVIKTWWR